MAKIITYDTTLRDGEQAQGVTLSLEDKLRIARRLDEFGIDYIEGGFPASNPKDIAFFAELRERPLSHARLVAFGSTCRKGIAADEDAGLADLVASGAPVAAIVGKTWDEQVTRALQTTLEENLRMISDSVRYLKSHGLEVVFDAEHFFDGYKANPDYALSCVRAAAEAGADSIDLCETNGGALPFEVAEIVAAVVRELGASACAVEDSTQMPSARADCATPASEASDSRQHACNRENLAGISKLGAVLGTVSASPRVGIHCHNDSGCAVANTLAAVREGARQVQGTVNGYGERVGNADLLTIIADLELKMGHECVGPEALKELTSVAAYVAEICNFSVWAHAPYVGSAAFVHKGGLHASAIARFPQAYEHEDPTAVGNTAHVLVSELAGKASLIAKARTLGFDLAAYPDKVQEILDVVKEHEALGYSYEVADGSLALLIARNLDSYKPYFTLESFRVIVDDREDTGALAKDAQSEATIKVHVGDERFVATGEGVGPVGALSKALKMALSTAYPQVKNMHLIDFKVRLLDESTGTDAITRVVITTRDDHGIWGTIGVSENIIEASWNALVESVECGLMRIGV